MMQEEASRYIPQRPPFVMVDTLLQADGNLAKTCFLVREGHLFVEHGVFTDPGLVENMAQTAAAATGYTAAAAGKAAPVGFIGALKGLQIRELPLAGDTITTEISVIHQVLNAHIVRAIVRSGEKELASCELKIFLQSETQND